jgi:hypothetical protein
MGTVVPIYCKVADNLSETERPNDTEIDFVRHFTLTEAVGRKMMYELGMINAILNFTHDNFPTG